jgi:predicted ribosome quality control (RQC) complex YloA/Tae2 family protein
MKKELSSLELSVLVKEFSILVDSKIDQIYQPEDKTLVLQLHIPGTGKKNLTMMLPGFIFLSSKKMENPEQAPQFCMALRKRVGGARIRNIRQIGSERVIEITLATKDCAFFLIVELYAKGNILLCDPDYTIVSILEQRKMKDRFLKPGAHYDFPEKDINLFTLKLEELEKAITCSTRDKIVSKLAVDVGLGGTFSEEALLNAGINKNKSSVTEDEQKTLYKEIRILIDKGTAAVLLAEDVLPFGIKKYENEEKQGFQTFNEALDVFLTKNYEAARNVESYSKFNKRIDKLNRIIEEQQKSISALEEDISESTRKAEVIYQNYRIVDEVISEINKAKQKFTFAEIKEKLKGHKIIKEINAKDKKVLIELT